MRKYILLLLVVVFSHGLIAQSFDPKIFSSLNFRFIGPDGNRMIAVAGEPGNPNVSYAGAASGGLWKTDDAGVTWTSGIGDPAVGYSRGMLRMMSGEDIA